MGKFNVLGAVLAFGVISSSASAFAQSSPLKVTLSGACRIDAQVDAEYRRRVDAFVLDFAMRLTNGEADKVFANLSPALAQSIGKDDNGKMVTQIHAMAPYGAVHVIHDYVIDEGGAGDEVRPAYCGASDTDIDGITVSTLPGRRQVYVEVSAHTFNNDWSIFIWLDPEGDSFRVLGYAANASAVSGRTSRDLAQAARVQNERGHGINAALLYAAAKGVSERGPDVSTNWKGDLDAEVSAFRPPAEMIGPSPLHWWMGEHSPPVLGASVVGIAGDLDIIVAVPVDNWPDDATVNEGNKKLLIQIVRNYPELADSFKVIFLEAHKADGTTLFRTSYEFGKGFD